MYKNKDKSSHLLLQFTGNKYFFPQLLFSLQHYSCHLQSSIRYPFCIQNNYTSASEGYSRYYYLHHSKVILLQYYYWRWHKVAVIKQLPPHIRLQSSTISHPFLSGNKLHIQGEGRVNATLANLSLIIATQFKSHVLF